MNKPIRDEGNKAKSKKILNVMMFAGIIVVCFSLLLFTVSLMNRYTDTVEDKISDKARLYAVKSGEVVTNFLAESEGVAQRAAGVLQDKNDPTEFATTLATLDTSLRASDAHGSMLTDVRYVKDGVLYDKSGNPNAHQQNFRDLITAASQGKNGSFGSVIDPDVKSGGTEVGMEVLAFYAPVTNNQNADAVILFYIETILDFIPNLQKEIPTVNTAEFVLLCSKEGRVIRIMSPTADYDGALPVSLNDNLFTVLEYNLGNKNVKNTLLDLLGGGESGVVTFDINGERFAMSVSQSAACEDYAVVSMFSASNLDKAETTAFTSVGAMLIVLCLTIPVVFFAILGFKHQHDKQMNRAKNYDSKMQCPTFSGMEELIPKQVVKYPGSSFAIVGGRLKHYQYLKANYAEIADQMLYQIRRLLDTSLAIGEVVGLGNESEFILLLHYRDTASLTTRLYNLSNYVTQNIGNNQYNVHLDFGVYQIEKGTKESTRQMIDNAFSVIESDASNSAVTTVSVYNLIFRENYLKNAEVEVKMDYALEHDEFKVFFQPKINSETGAIDGCEALVRWLDAETGQFRAPGTFLPLFEQNGFIVKLDRYVFYKVCEFIGSRVSEHLPIFPTSVNISRVSAINAEFLEYYASVKKQFNVPDDFLTLELTESIASSSYDTLNRMSIAFHKNRFLLSIDDFGSGYSSMNVLKNVVVDEIKMDRIFLDAGVSEKRDKTIMASIVKLANDLGIKVVQEGVETAEQLKTVQEAGCKIIQGYYFSKPLSIPEYIKFVNMKMDEEERNARQRTYKNLDDDYLPPEETPAEDVTNA